MTFRAAGVAAALALCAPAFAGEAALQGQKDIVLHTRDGKAIVLGRVTFAPQGAGATFRVDWDDRKFTVHFLSMREFKCVEGEEILCQIPYPYGNPKQVTLENLSWLDHALLFFYKRPSDYGAKLAQGLIFPLKPVSGALEGAAESIDLDEIASPPEDRTKPYYDAERRTKIEPGARWAQRLSLENHR
jgi:hypothetical protein